MNIILQAAVLIHFMWMAPLEFVIVVIFLLIDFGVAFLAGVGVMVLVVVVQQIISRFYGKLR